MNHISVCYVSGEWLLCEIWCIETTTEDHHHHKFTVIMIVIIIIIKPRCFELRWRVEKVHAVFLPRAFRLSSFEETLIPFNIRCISILGCC